MPQWLPKCNLYWFRLCVYLPLHSPPIHPFLAQTLTNAPRIIELITLIFWLSSFSVLVWECMSGDAVFAVLGASGVPDVVSYVTASSVRAAIVGLKFATGLACIVWLAFATTFVMLCMCFASPYLGARCLLSRCVCSFSILGLLTCVIVRSEAGFRMTDMLALSVHCSASRLKW